MRAFALVTLLLASSAILSCGEDEGPVFVCSCSMTFNGFTDSWDGCGVEKCVNGRTFTCEPDGARAVGTCKANPRPEVPTPASSGGDGSEAPETPTFRCGGQSCQKDAQYCIESALGPDPLVRASLCSPRPEACNGCDCLRSDAEAAWSLGQPTPDCTGATLLCTEQDGGFTVRCWKSSL